MSGMKREPIPYAVNPAAVSQIGEALGNHATDTGKILHGASEPMYEGKGYKAPKMTNCSSNCGSQGKY